MKKLYVTPEVESYELDAKDVITTSVDNDNYIPDPFWSGSLKPNKNLQRDGGGSLALPLLFWSMTMKKTAYTSPEITVEQIDRESFLTMSDDPYSKNY